ncbi:MAG: YidC/Oxa1 family membrane protein insertase [Candidatus Moranbacteria bacterium]|nr:YidC/Oxa1 family membrane protein insertase [Candidatus Moranbacteria bacterium]
MNLIFHTIVYDPLYNILIGLYDSISFGDFGIAIILTTILLKFFLIPLSKKQIESQKSLQELQPKIKELQIKYKNDKEKQARELMALYKKEKVNPFGGCLPLIIQLIFFIAIYRVLIDISGNNFAVSGELLYSFIPNPGQVETSFLGLVDLTQPSVVLAIITAIAQYIQMKMMMQKRENEKTESLKEDGKKASQKISLEKKGEPHSMQDFSETMNKQMLYLFPGITLFVGLTFGAGLILYWLTSTLFMIAQQWYIMKHTPTQG